MELSRLLAIFHRITGWGLLAYIVFHVVFIHQISLGSTAWQWAQALDENLLTRITLVFVDIALVFHGLNGLRIILIEWGVLLPSKARPPVVEASVWYRGGRHRSYIALMTILGIILTVYFVIQYMP